jgi:hypothetical protein
MTQFDEVYGPCAPADYEIGSELCFLRDGRVCRGELLHVCRPGPVIVGEHSYPTLYIVDDGSGWPVPVAAKDIVALG